MKRFVICMYDISTDYETAQLRWDDGCDCDYTRYKLLNTYGDCIMDGDTTHDNIYNQIFTFLDGVKYYANEINEEVVVDCYVIFKDEVTVKVEM